MGGGEKPTTWSSIRLLLFICFTLWGAFIPGVFDAWEAERLNLELLGSPGQRRLQGRHGGCVSVSEGVDGARSQLPCVGAGRVSRLEAHFADGEAAAPERTDTVTGELTPFAACLPSGVSLPGAVKTDVAKCSHCGQPSTENAFPQRVTGHELIFCHRGPARPSL